MSDKKNNAVASVIKGPPAKQRQFNYGPVVSPQFVGTSLDNYMLGVNFASGPDENDWWYNAAEIELGANNFMVYAPGGGGWTEGRLSRAITGVRANRAPQGNVKAKWKMHEQVTLPGTKPRIDRNNIYHDYQPIFRITAPVNGDFVVAGGNISVTLAIVQDDCFAAASKTWKVLVEKDTPVIQWAVPVPLVVVGTKLSADHLNATTQFEKIGVRKPVIVYDKPIGTDLTEAKPVTITASFAANQFFNAAVSKSVTLKVVADLKTAGVEGMMKGESFKRPQSGPRKLLLDQWDSDNSPTGIKATSKKVMADIKGMTGDEIEEHMDKFINPTGTAAIGTRTPPGPMPPYPDPTGKVINIIWELPNGMQVRCKPYGDDAAVKGPAMFCVEGKTCVGPSTNDKQVAFKVTADGFPGAYGPKQTLLAPGVPTDKASLEYKNYMDGACGTTHLECKAKVAQTITWDNPPDITVGTALGKASLSAKADDPASLRYTDDADKEITETTMLPAKKGQVLKVTSLETKKYLATTVPVTATVNVNRKVQTIKWTPVTKSVFAEAELGDDVLNAVPDDPKAVLTYTDDKGNVITRTSKLAAHYGQLLRVTAAETDTHDAVTVPVTATIDIDLRPQTITWAPKVASVFAEAELGGDVLNAVAGDPRAVLSYTDDKDVPLTAASKLAAKKGQVLKVTAAATSTHAAVAAPVTATIDIDLRPQTITWAPKVASVFAEAELGGDVLNAVAGDPRAVLSYTDDKDAPLTAASKLAAKKGQVLKVTAAATSTHAALSVPVTATIDIDLRPQTLTWTPKRSTAPADIALGADVLNAVAEDSRAALTYTDDTGTPITTVSKLAAKKGQVLKVTAAATSTHAAVTNPVTVTIDVEAKQEQAK